MDNSYNDTEKNPRGARAIVTICDIRDNSRIITLIHKMLPTHWTLHKTVSRSTLLGLNNVCMFHLKKKLMYHATFQSSDAYFFVMLLDMFFVIFIKSSDFKSSYSLNIWIVFVKIASLYDKVFYIKFHTSWVFKLDPYSLPTKIGILYFRLENWKRILKSNQIYSEAAVKA